jgi:hypothetical protein
MQARNVTWAPYTYPRSPDGDVPLRADQLIYIYKSQAAMEKISQNFSMIPKITMISAPSRPVATETAFLSVKPMRWQKATSPAVYAVRTSGLLGPIAGAR